MSDFVRIGSLFFGVGSLFSGIGGLELVHEHGDLARVRARTGWDRTLPCRWARIDYLLARAGIPKGVQLGLGLDNGTESVHADT